jgi:hypothetical protein
MPGTKLVLRALRKGIGGKEAEITSDRVFLHCGYYIELLKENGIKISMT